MERTRPQPAQATDAGAATAICPGCGASLELDRCEGCGAAPRAGGYRVLRVLHESDHARVYLAEDEGGARVALKELIFSRAPDAQTLDAFAREAAVLRELRHPAIPRFLASFSEGTGPATRLYLAQEYVEGTSLEARLREHRFDEAEALAIARRALEVLRYLHGLSPPVVHRDLKPANLILRHDGSLALVDFGCAREVAPRGTHRATVAGTFGYMPPEALGGSLDRSADLYGLGATLIHLLSRKAPEELLWERGPSVLGSELNASPGTVRFLAGLTARDRAARIPGVEEALAALDAPGLHRPPADAAARAGARERASAGEHQDRRVRWITGVLLAACGAIAYAAFNHPPPSQRPPATAPAQRVLGLGIGEVVPSHNGATYVDGVQHGFGAVSILFSPRHPSHEVSLNRRGGPTFRCSTDGASMSVAPASIGNGDHFAVGGTPWRLGSPFAVSAASPEVEVTILDREGQELESVIFRFTPPTK